jgi:hypothetical protein
MKILSVTIFALLIGCSSTKSIVHNSSESEFFVSKPILDTVDTDMTAELTEDRLEGTSENRNILFFSWGESSDSAKFNAIKDKVDGIFITRKTVDINGFWPIFWKETTTIKGKGIKYKFLGVKDSSREYSYDQYLYKTKQRNNLRRVRDELVSKRYKISETNIQMKDYSNVFDKSELEFQENYTPNSCLLGKLLPSLFKCE